MRIFKPVGDLAQIIPANFTIGEINNLIIMSFFFLLLVLLNGIINIDLLLWQRYRMLLNK